MCIVKCLTQIGAIAQPAAEAIVRFARPALDVEVVAHFADALVGVVDKADNLKNQIQHDAEADQQQRAKQTDPKIHDFELAQQLAL